MTFMTRIYRKDGSFLEGRRWAYFFQNGYVYLIINNLMNAALISCPLKRSFYLHYTATIHWGEFSNPVDFATGQGKAKHSF